MKAKYELKAVAFIDILGFRNTINDPNNFNKAKRVIESFIKEKKENDKFKDLIKSIKMSVFSDSIFISASFELGGFFIFWI